MNHKGLWPKQVWTCLAHFKVLLHRELAKFEFAAKTTGNGPGSKKFYHIVYTHMEAFWQKKIEIRENPCNR